MTSRSFVMASKSTEYINNLKCRGRRNQTRYIIKHTIFSPGHDLDSSVVLTGQLSFESVCTAVLVLKRGHYLGIFLHETG